MQWLQKCLVSQRGLLYIKWQNTQSHRCLIQLTDFFVSKKEKKCSKFASLLWHNADNLKQTCKLTFIGKGDIFIRNVKVIVLWRKTELQRENLKWIFEIISLIISFAENRVTWKTHVHSLKIYQNHPNEILKDFKHVC